MLLKNPLAISKVGPTMMTKVIRMNARAMLTIESRCTPLSSPDRTETRATAVIAMISKVIVTLLLGTPNR